ncbi:hypothetical protein CEXT_737791 [Caerostris extrusa]|uniref:Uncharacterized protein n=1 Tax=Caerostris extrusa TaxID=172846 RepID=A0AAV4Y136_CAEEX|nr:hypothetical protein CEXT_737791 [Caerostris extrusa]
MSVLVDISLILDNREIPFRLIITSGDVRDDGHHGDHGDDGHGDHGGDGRGDRDDDGRGGHCDDDGALLPVLHRE